jgi:hypothetical protein
LAPLRFDLRKAHAVSDLFAQGGSQRGFQIIYELHLGSLARTALALLSLLEEKSK